MAETIAKPGHNQGDPKVYGEFLRSFFRIEDDKNSLRQTHRAQLAPYAAQQKQVRTLVREAGFSVAGFNELVLREKARRAEKNRIANLDDDVLHEIESLEGALGDYKDTPLGEAAVAAAQASQPKSNGAELLNNLVQLHPA